jgi:hypothetical protein
VRLSNGFITFYFSKGGRVRIRNYSEYFPSPCLLWLKKSILVNSVPVEGSLLWPISRGRAKLQAVARSQ